MSTSDNRSVLEHALKHELKHALKHAFTVKDKASAYGKGTVWV